MKICERLVDSRLKKMVAISQVQWGFMPERSITYVIFIAGSALSPFPSVLTLDCTVKHLEKGPLRTILYTDDIALVADSREELEEKEQLWRVALADNGLRLNVKKTKFISSMQCTRSILDCQGEVIEKVKEFL
ncbi:unnamed protein product [Heligmosomoides polygyrus]|uniref:Reverse transcriptase domain-containing protein n=1 Tax=Heligmosomoides polygyrus TaxID=6339 RepID=A0A183GSK9_HELPZ|nr:unnamed protein product [Heligmosomoides polygyrus]